MSSIFINWCPLPEIKTKRREHRSQSKEEEEKNL